MAVPVHWGGELRGVLSVAYRRRVRAQPRAARRARVVRRARRGRVPERATSTPASPEAARTDPLTGCLNHAALHDGLAREIERAERTPGTPLSLVLIDLDRFKEVNDEHGHLVGDEVLRRVGHALRSTTRPYDLAARYGGDEFALVAVDADEDRRARSPPGRSSASAFALGDLAGERRPARDRGRGPVGARAHRRRPDRAADRALLYGKRAGPPRRGAGHRRAARHVPPRPRRAPQPPRCRSRRPAPSLPWQPRRDDDAAARLRRRTRQLALANRLGRPARGDDRRRRDPRRGRRGAPRGVRLLHVRGHPPAGRRAGRAPWPAAATRSSRSGSRTGASRGRPA